MITSIHDLLNAQGHFPRQRFVEYFSGKQISAIWSVTENQGTNTEQMSDSINGGFEIITGTTFNDRSTLHFNDIGQFSPTSSIWVSEMETDSTNSQLVSGLAEDNNFTNAFNIWEGIQGQTYWRVQTQAVSATTVDSDVNFDTTSHTFRCDLQSSKVEGYLDSTLKTTNTSNLPDAGMHPIFRVGNRLASSAYTGKIKYFEVYNK